MGEIQENQQTKLFFKLADSSEKELNCTIKKIYSDRISLNFPEDVNDYLDYLQEGDEISVKIFTPTGIKAFDAVILNSPIENDFVIEFVEDYLEIQRRMYLRMEFNAKVLIERGKTNIVTHTLDIGGGGIRFFYEGSLDDKETVNCHLFLPMLPTINAQGIIIKDPRLNENEYVMVFTNIEEKNRDKIIKKCFELQVNSL